jgi:hypothetical protein
MSKLTTRIRPRAVLSRRETAAMFSLYETYYDGSSYDLFCHDLAGKSDVIELHAGDALAGFSTLAVMGFEHAGEANRAIFSGDTIIHHDYWGEQALVGAFCGFAGGLKARFPREPLFWLLISKGYRTYRYLDVFAHDYYPHRARPTPRGIAERIERLARDKFGEAYDADSGIVSFAQSRGHLRPQWATVREPLHVHRTVRFFLQRNPRYHAGEEMVCLTELCADNLRSFARRAFVAALNAESAQLA